jgi:uncharacterized repeat protein (TIGR03803 family)
MMRIAPVHFAATLFSAVMLLSPAAFAKQRETVFYSFGKTSSDGIAPQSGLVADKAGNLYGTTYLGGAFDNGTVFVVGTNGLETVIYSFGSAENDGINPTAALTFDKNGNLYGTTTAGGAANKGIVFELTPNGENWQKSTLYSFCALTNCVDGATPTAAITVGPKGVLFGTTEQGGAGAVAQNAGTVFRLDPPKKHSTAWTQTVLYNFCSQSSCSDGKFPYGATLLLSKTGTLYGTTTSSQLGGALYSVSSTGGGYQLLHSFGNTGDGATVNGGVTADSSGVLYGTTKQGGAHGCGTVYSFDPTSFVYRQLYSCTQSTDPAFMYGGITIVEKKRGTTLYAASLSGGANGDGAIFSLTPAEPGDPWTEQTLYSFCAKANCTDGTEPSFVTLLDIDNAFYGTTMGGGRNNKGAVFRYGKR